MTAQCMHTAHVFQVFRFEIPVANLPRMAKLCVGVFEKKKNNTQHPLFWVNAYVFDYRCRHAFVLFIL